MNFYIILICSSFHSLASGQRFSKSIEVQPAPTYSANVLHTFSGNLDNWPESSINPNNLERPANNKPIQNQLRSKFGSLYTNSPTTIMYGSKQAVGSTNVNPNAFNVEYNIRFGQDSNNNNNNKKQRFTIHNANKKFENAEIITGKMKRNEKVRAPSHNIKSPLISHINKPEFLIVKQKPTVVNYNRAPDMIHNVQASYQASQWKNISPNVQMTQSVEGPNFYGKAYEPREVIAASQHPEFIRAFNHEHAMRNSQTFDISNVNGEKIYDNTPENSEKYSQIHHISTPENINVEAHIPSHLRGVKPLPLDTSLLKDVVLTPHVKDVGKDTKLLPIHFDIRQIQEAMQKEIGRNKFNYEMNYDQNNQEFGIRQRH